MEVSQLRDAIGRIPGLIALETTAVLLPATDEEFIPDLAHYRYDELLLLDGPRKMALLHATPRYVPDAEASRYSVTMRTSYGEPLELPEPFNRAIDTSIFEH